MAWSCSPCSLGIRAGNSDEVRGSELDAQRKDQSMQEQDSAAEVAPAERIASRQLPIPGGTARQGHPLQKPNSLESGSFLSLSPTMQWLQVSWSS